MDIQKRHRWWHRQQWRRRRRRKETNATLQHLHIENARQFLCVLWIKWRGECKKQEVAYYNQWMLPFSLSFFPSIIVINSFDATTYAYNNHHYIRGTLWNVTNKRKKKKCRQNDKNKQTNAYDSIHKSCVPVFGQLLFRHYCVYCTLLFGQHISGDSNSGY